MSLTVPDTIIPLNDAKIYYDGVFFPQIHETKVLFNRHDSMVYEHKESGIFGPWIRQWVNTQSGVRIRFQTASPRIYLGFEKRNDGAHVTPEPMNGFSIFANGKEIGTFSSLMFTIESPYIGSSVIYEVVLPNLWAVNLTEFKIDNRYFLEELTKGSESVYAALGTSITHGTGQYCSSARTYPFILARKMGWRLYNLAVAGATLGWAIALSLKDKKIDYISIEIGFNDWKFLPESLSDKKSHYEKLIDTIREYQPGAVIYCISPIITTESEGEASYLLDEFRGMVKEVVMVRYTAGDNRLHFIDGALISDESMLDDGVHLNEYGASVLANKLVEIFIPKADSSIVQN